MRDYSFGNFISALRMRRGLSQYQLGALVGVSDKAVSKWENGVSKPRMNTIVKLAEVLDVGTDELLACKYVTFSQKRKDLFVMDNDILKKAEYKMAELYGEHPPIRVKNRFVTEKLMLKDQKMLRWMGFLGELQAQLYEQNDSFLVRGAQLGASFIAWLLGGTNVNPLPAHYYCKTCKKIEFIPTAKCGLDLPDKMCSCGSLYERDGFAIDAIHMYPLNGGGELYLSCHAMETVRNCFKDYFGEYSEIREIHITDETEGPYKVARYILVSGNLAERYPDEVISVTAEEYYQRFSRMDRLVAVKNEEEQIGFKDLADTRFTCEEIRSYAKYAAAHGAFIDISGENDLNAVVSRMADPKYSDLLAVSGLLHGTGVWSDNGEKLYKKGIPVTELISNREDAYAFLYGKLKGIECENPSGQVFEIKDNLQKGKYTRGRMPEDLEHLLLESGVPEWYVDSMKKIQYVFPKAHLVAYLKKDICKYSMR